LGLDYPEWREKRLIDGIANLAREFAADALRSMYDVDDYDADDERARGGYRPKPEYQGTNNIERRRYRNDFNDMIAAAIKAAEGE
jgi:hypothetical protein